MRHAFYVNDYKVRTMRIVKDIAGAFVIYMSSFMSNSLIERQGPI